MGDFNAPPASEILVEVELFLKLERLVARVGLSGSLVARTGLWLLHPGIDMAVAVIVVVAARGVVDVAGTLGRLDLIHLGFHFEILLVAGAGTTDTITATTSATTPTPTSATPTPNTATTCNRVTLTIIFRPIIHAISLS